MKSPLRLLVSLAACAAATLSLLAQAAFADSPVVYITNQSRVVPQDSFQVAVQAFQTAVSRDFAPIWGLNASLTLDPSVPHQMELVVADEVNCSFCYGYHTVTSHSPVSYIDAKQSQADNEDWRLVATHELFEMLADPWINRYSWFKGRSYLVEVADPVESGYYAYFIGDVPISDFITPAWYGGIQNQPVDFTHGLQKPGQIGRHGYSSWWDGYKWHQAFG